MSGVEGFAGDGDFHPYSGIFGKDGGGNFAAAVATDNGVEDAVLVRVDRAGAGGVELVADGGGVEELENDVHGGGDGGAARVSEPALERELAGWASQAGGVGVDDAKDGPCELFVTKKPESGGKENEDGQVKIGSERMGVIGLVERRVFELGQGRAEESGHFGDDGT